MLCYVGSFRASNAKLDLGKFAKLAELQVLKLRGVVGLVQPAFSFSGGLSQLSNLSNLHTLVRFSTAITCCTIDIRVHVCVIVFSALRSLV